jgi:glyoxylase I family protein
MRYLHTALAVKSIPKSQEFYEQVFGMKFKTQGERPELGVKFIMLEDKKGMVVELFEHHHPHSLKEDLMDFSQVSIKHIAFAVEDIEKVIKRAAGFGAKIIWPIKKGITVKRIAFISDPDGIPIELVEL